MGAEGKTVLIVEDDADVRDLFIYELTHEGYRVQAADSRDEALQLVTTHGVPATIIIDYHMPGMTLDQFLEKLAVLHPKLPRLILTTAGAQADEVATRTGIAEVLRKPFDPLNIMEQVSGAVA